MSTLVVFSEHVMYPVGQVHAAVQKFDPLVDEEKGMQFMFGFVLEIHLTHCVTEYATACDTDALDPPCVVDGDVKLK